MKPLKQPKINWNEKSETGPKAVVMRRGLAEPLTRGETSKPSYQPRRHETATPTARALSRRANNAKNETRALVRRRVERDCQMFLCSRLKYLSARNAATSPATMLTGNDPMNILTSRPNAGPYGPQLPSPECVNSPTAAAAPIPAAKVTTVTRSQVRNTFNRGDRFI